MAGVWAELPRCTSGRQGLGPTCPDVCPVQVGMRHFNLNKNHYFNPIVNLDKLWSLVGEEVSWSEGRRLQANSACPQLAWAHYWRTQCSSCATRCPAGNGG